MTDRQIVSRYSGAIVPAGHDSSNDLSGWRLRIEESLMARLNQMTTDPNFLLEIEQKTEACFNELMAEGVEKLNQLATELSTTVDQELTTFKKKAGDHLEERIQLATRSAHAEADIHAARLRNDTENQINKHLQRLIGEAKAEARDFAVAEVKTSLDRADQHIVSKTDGAITTMMTRFNTDASDRVTKLVKESLSTVRTTLQTFADDHIVEMRRRVDEDVDRVFREVRKKEERAAVALIKTHAMEEKRLISTAIEEKIDAVFNEAREKQKRALSLLDERADAHSTAVHQAIQRHVKSAWLSSESEIKASINEKVEVSLNKHRQELIEYVDRKDKEEAQDLSARVENALKAYVVGEIKAQDQRQKQFVVEAVDRALSNVDDRIKTGISTATIASNAVSDTKIISIERSLNAVRRDVQDAVRDLDDKIALVSRTLTPSSSGASVASPQEHLAKDTVIDAALASLDTKIQAEVARVLSASDNSKSDFEDRLDAVRRDVQDAVRDLDDKIALVSRTLTPSSSGASVASPQEHLAKDTVIDAALASLDTKIQAEVARVLSASDNSKSDFEDRLDAVRRDVQDAVRDLDDKIALVSRTLTPSSSGASVASPQERLAKDTVIDAALASLDTKIQAEVTRALSKVDSQSAIPTIVRREIVTAMGDVEVALRDQLDKIETIRKTEEVENRKLRDEIALLKNSHDDLIRKVNCIDEKVATQSRHDRIQSAARTRATGTVKSEHLVQARAFESGTHRVAVKTEDSGGARYSTPGSRVRDVETGNQPGHQHTVQPRCQVAAEAAVLANNQRIIAARVSTASTQTSLERPIFDEYASAIGEMQRAWDAAADEANGLPIPNELRTLGRDTVRAFLQQLGEYRACGGKQHWSAFVRPGLLTYIRSCELGEDATDSAILCFIEQKGGGDVQFQFAQYNGLFASVHVDEHATSPADQVASVLMGMEDAIAMQKQRGGSTEVPLDAYKSILLSKLPASFRDNVEELDKATTKKEIKEALLSIPERR